MYNCQKEASQKMMSMSDFERESHQKNEWGDNENLQPFSSLLVSRGSKGDGEMGVRATATQL